MDAIDFPLDKLRNTSCSTPATKRMPAISSCLGAVGDEFCTLDVKEQPHPVHGHAHGQISFT